MPAIVDYDFEGVGKPCFDGESDSLQENSKCVGGSCMWADCCNLAHRDESLPEPKSPSAGRMITGGTFAYDEAPTK